MGLNRRIVWLLSGMLMLSFHNFAQLKPAAHSQAFDRSATVLLAQPFPDQSVTLTDSWIKKRESENVAWLLRLDPERLLHNFRVNAGIHSAAQPLEGWESPGCGLRGHFVGHYLSACATWTERSGDLLLERRIRYMTDALGECQLKLGGKYLSAFPESEFDKLEKNQGGVWAPYYTCHKIMQGLLDVYTCTGYEKAFRIVLNLADYVSQRMARLPDSEIEKMLFTAEANPTNEAGGMNEVLHNLYAISNDPKHLKLAQLFDRKWFYRPLAEGRDILSGLHANTHIVLVNGYARRYEHSGETEFREAAVNFWEMLINHHAYVNGSGSGPRPIATTPTSRIAEHWGVADHQSATLTGQIAESCVTHNTQKLTANLFEWSADPQYAAAYMNTFYNAVMAAQNMEDGRTVYHLPLGSPRKKEFLKENDFRCCNGSGMEAFSRLNSNIYFHNQQNLWVNLFIPSQLSWEERGITLKQSGNFPEDPKISFRISALKPVNFALQIFIPSWATAQTKISVNGQPLKTTIKPLEFTKIERLWQEGDSVEIQFGYDYYLKSMPDNDQVVALFYGPVLLAFETEHELILKGNHQTILQNLVKNEGEFTFRLHNNNQVFNLKPFYAITNQSYGVYATIRNEY